jgi:hypothetical protein
MNASHSPSPENKKKLYALLVGINTYREEIKVGSKSVYFPRLSACIDDAKKIQTYLEADNFYTTDIITLYNEQATRPAIIETFTKHLGQAREGDVALFYFSGHGTQEDADPVLFPTETDKKLESLACYYDESLKNNFLLADKELRWLIKQVADNNPHIVAIFDCCHSGENTRNAVRLNRDFKKVTEKKSTYSFPQRDWEQFVFSKTINKEDLIIDGLTKTLPEGRHVQLSACEADESAVEIDQEGVFTKVLINVLNGVGGDLSYQSLRSRVRQYMRGVYDQKPKVYYSNSDTNTKYLAFLNKPYNISKNVFAEITYNESREWQLNLGALHGIRKDQALEIFDAADPTQIINATIGAIKIDHSEIIPAQKLDEKKVYFTNWEGLGTKAIHIHFDTNDANLQHQQAIFQELFTGPNQRVIAEDDETDAQYVLHFLNDKYYLTLPHDRYRPLFKPLNASEVDLPKKLSFCLNTVAAWETLKQLVNEDVSTTIPVDALTIETAIGSAQYAPLNGDTITMGYIHEHGEWKNTLKIKLKNNTNKNLYVCCVHFLTNFECHTTFLNPQVYQLTANASVELNQDIDSVLTINLSDFIKWYNWKEEKEMIKFIISTENFDENLLNMEGLTPPPIPERNKSAAEVHRGIARNERPRVRGWRTVDVKLIYNNPLYNTITEKNLQLMMQDKDTRDFARGLYYEPTTADTPLTVRAEIQIIP